jgi:hypothetical protein
MLPNNGSLLENPWKKSWLTYVYIYWMMLEKLTKTNTLAYSAPLLVRKKR